MKICRECGTPCADETVFCYVCGAKFRMNTSTIDRGLVSEYFATNTDNVEAVLVNPAILIIDKDISDIYSVLPLLEESAKNGRQLLIIANSYGEEVINTLVVNKLRGVLACAAIKAPGFGESRKEMLKDIAILTGGQVISSDAGIELKDTSITLCGQAKIVRVTKEETVITDGNGDEQSIKERISYLKELIPITQSDWDRERIQSRLVNLFGLTKSDVL